MILTLTNFQSSYLKLPNARVSANGADFSEEIQAAIDEREREILIDGLGIALYDSLVTEYADLGTASQPILDLVNGKDYTVNNIAVRWDGLISNPFLGCYVYYHFMQEKQDVFTTMGTQSPEAVSSQAVSAIDTSVRRYRKFIKGYQGEDGAPLLITTAFGSGIDYQGSNSKIRSLYQFLTDNSTDYPTATDFIAHKSINSQGI